jgi:AraC-like DNA-binding protein
MATLLDTSRLDADVRPEALQAVLTAASAPHELTFLDPETEVFARLEHFHLGGGVDLLVQESSGIAHTRSDAHKHLPGPEKVVFVLHDGGPGSYIQDDKQYPLERGGLYVTDLNSQYSYRRPGNGVARIAVVERSTLGMSLEQVQAAAGRLIASPLYDLLRSHIAALCRDAEQISSTSRATIVGEATARMAQVLLQTTTESRSPDRRGQLAQYLRDRVLLFVEQNFANPHLTAEYIAHEHGVSTRYLFKAWAGEPRGLSETILAVRLEAGQRQLEANPSLTVAAVAHRCGFPDASHFSRRFRGAYGMTPSEWRAG